MPHMDKRRRYAEAMTAERDAWNDAKHSLPGSPGFDEGKWKRWRAALGAVARAMDDTRPSSPTPRKAEQRPARDW